MFMQGGPSHVDTFDYKPHLAKRRRQVARRGRRRQGQPQADEVALEVHPSRQERPADLRAVPEPGQARRRPVPAQQHAHRPAEPSAGRRADAHRQLPVRPAAAWARGCCTAWAPRTRSCPASSRSTRSRRVGGARELRQLVPAGAVPGHADRRRRAERSPTPRFPTSPTATLTRDQQRKQLDLLQSINRDRLAAGQGQPRARRRHRVVRAGLPHADGRAEADGLRRTNRPARSAAYGIGGGPTDNFGRQCLLARRFAEAGVRFIELGHGRLGPAQQPAGPR